MSARKGDGRAAQYSGAAPAALHEASALALPPATLYGILRLRSEVFVVEQECAYLDLDGRDLEDRALQLWVERDGRIVAALRLLWDEPRVARIGRVVTDPSVRSEGHAGRLMRRALELAEAQGASSVVLDAQFRLESWYGGFGFVVTGPAFLEDGLEHLPMTRTYAGTHGL